MKVGIQVIAEAPLAVFAPSEPEADADGPGDLPDGIARGVELAIGDALPGAGRALGVALAAVAGSDE